MAKKRFRIEIFNQLNMEQIIIRKMHILHASQNWT